MLSGDFAQIIHIYIRSAMLGWLVDNREAALEDREHQAQYVPDLQGEPKKGSIKRANSSKVVRR